MELLRQNYNPAETGNQYQNIIREVLQKHIYPEDEYEIAAILEANGWNDDRAAEEFGAESLFILAENIWRLIQKQVTAQPFSSVPMMSTTAHILMLIRSFLRGMIVALPMAVSVFAMLTLKFSLWSYLNLSLELATSIAIGTIMSFMAIGGFTQAIARRGFLYICMGYYDLARRIVFYFVRLGYVVCFGFALIYLLFNLFFNVFPFRMSIIIVAYFLFLSTIWLSVTIMYVLRKELTFTGLLTGGIGLVFIFFKIYKLDIIVSQLIALAIVSIIGAIIAYYYFKTMEQKMEKGIASATLPRTSITVYTVLPYFAYGFLYFTFIFMDRVIAWSTSGLYMPYLIWFRGPYELGLDLALITLIIPMGFIEAVINEIMTNIECDQKNYQGIQAPALGRKYLANYYKRLFFVVLFSTITAIVVYLVVRFIHLNPWYHVETGLLVNKITHNVFVVGLVGYTILCLGLLNAITLFSLSQPEMVSRAILIGLFTNILIGFPLSRWFDHSLAVFGLLVGAIVFSVMSTKSVVKVLKSLDYYLYASS